MDQNLEQFKNWLKVNGMAKNTIIQRTGYMKKYLKKHSELTNENVQEFLLSLHDRLGKGTINNYRKAIVSYCAFKEADIKIPKSLTPEKKNVDFITEEQFIQEVLPMIEMTFDYVDKPLAIICMYFYTGLRRSEIVQLKRKQFDFENNIINVVRQKTGIETEIYLHPKVVQYVKRYFITEEQDENAFNLSINKVDSMFRKLKKEFEEFNLRPLLLRHSFGTIASEKEVDIVSLSDMMGHTNVNSTQRYIKVTRDKKQKAIKKMFGDK